MIPRDARSEFCLNNKITKHADSKSEVPAAQGCLSKDQLPSPGIPLDGQQEWNNVQLLRKSPEANTEEICSQNVSSVILWQPAMNVNELVHSRDPSIKRSFCRRCSIALTPATSEISSADNETLGVVKCNKCGFEKKYPINDSYKLWSEQAEATQEVLEIGK